MKLTIRRSQADVKGIFGIHKGVKFSLYAKIDIKPEEKALIEKYQVGDWVLATRDFTIGNEEYQIKITVSKLMNGDSTTLANLADLQAFEEAIVESCRKVKNALEVMSTFGGEEVIEI